MGKKDSILFAFFVMVAVAAPPAVAQVTSKNFEPVTVGRLKSTPDVGKLEKVIKKALVHYGWGLVADEPGKIKATFEKSGGQISATIAISYGEGGYSIAYVDSKNLDADLKGKTIHRNYLRWIANLDKTIAEEYVVN